MKMTLRWFGKDFDSVTLQQIRQIPGVTGVITTLYDIPAGDVWPIERIKAMQAEVEAEGLKVEGIESVNIHDSIKIGSPDREQYIDNYIETLENLGKCGIDMVCYNFMPVFDWTRSELAHVDSEKLFENLVYFLKRIQPVCEKYDIKMAIHPDDPAWPVFNLPRIITCKENVERLLKAVDAKFNGLTLCTGSYGSNPKNDICEIINVAKGRIHFAHVRNLKHYKPGVFAEAAHLSRDGSMDMYKIVKTLIDTGFDGPVRPDHGRAIWGEVSMPGYGLYDRALGACYLNGLIEAIEKQEGIYKQ